MSENKDLKYHAVCPQCNKGFDCRKGVMVWGALICPDCEKKMRKYNELDEEQSA